MSSPAVLSNLLSSLPQRPPTPPRETHHEIAALVQPVLGSLDTRHSLHTPPGFQSPASSTLTTNSTTRRIRKRVGFSAQAEYKDPPVYVESEGVRQHPTPVSLPRSASKPVKSILKITNHTPNLLDPAAQDGCDPSNPQANLTTMLESTIQQLAGGDRESKLDAYLMLTRAWKASNNLPDRVALQEKMGLFTQFMQRDIVARTPEGNLDSSLVNHALNLLNTFLSFPAIASTISNDFGVFILDHCIRSFDDATTPKDTARRLMLVISLQNFSPKVITSDRVGRLVLSLHNIGEHLQGKSIVQSRIFIYRKLVQQSRQLMIVHSDWLLDMFTDMLSSIRDIRSAAISLGLEAAFSIGHEKQLSRKVMEVFNLSFEDKRYIQYYEETLSAMIKRKHEAAVVPEIWSVVILLLRIRLDSWEFAGPWLHIIQNCFNSADFPTKIAANHAWARLVYLMHLEERALPKNVSTLTKPLISQLRRKGSGKTSEELRQAILGGICNLFYYAFKPNTSSALLDIYWDTSVKPVLAKLLDPTAEAAEDNLHQASAILTGLFDCATPRIWRVDHIVESPLVRPEELPPIDSKWIRHNATRVFGAVEPILKQDFLALARTDTAASRLWQALVSAVASAAAKEIKVSRDTAVFVAEALGVLQKIWVRGPLGEESAEPNATGFLLAVRAYLKVMISSLGPLPFTDKTGKHLVPAKSPLHALFSMLSSLPPGVSDDKDFAEFFGSVFAPFFNSKGDKKARMDLAQDLLSAVPMETPRPYGVWLLVAETIVSWLEPRHNSHNSTGSAGETPVGNDYRDIVKVLERGIRSTPNLPSKSWQSLFYATFDRVREETGDAGVAIVLIEPLAKVLTDQPPAVQTADKPPSSVRLVTELVSVATQPRDRQAVEAARKRLWGTVLAGSRSSSFDTFDYLYKAANEALVYSYHNTDHTGVDSIVQLLKELGGFFDRCNRQLLLKTFTALQDGLLPWFQDDKRLLGTQTSSLLASVGSEYHPSDHAKLTGQTKSLWDKLAQLISEVEQPEQHLLCLEGFLCASFASCHRSVVNSGISLWNRLFQNAEHLDYPEELKAALVRMQLHADIALPGLEASSAEHAGQQQLSFIDSFDEFSLPRLPSTRSSSRKGTPRPTSSRSKSPASKPASRHRDTSLQKKPVAATRRSSPPRLRHDDSQVQFAAIEASSVLDSPVESQVLTERQQEVRERQRQNAGLFPEIRSSPGAKSTGSGRPVLPASPRTRQAATPEPERGFDDYVSSTPTPRRGQSLVMIEHDMADPPSSPPEPRGNPLAAEIRSRSASHSLLDEWQFSSSPVSGSPNPARHGVIPDPSSQCGYVSGVSLPEVDDVPEMHSGTVGENNKTAAQSPTDEIIEDSMIFERVTISNPAPEPAALKPDAPTTPRRSARLSQSQVQETPTPKSEGEVFVDAPSSPLPTSPKRPSKPAEATEESDVKKMPHSQVDNSSFDLSDGDDTGLLRLVVELDSGTVDRSEYHRSSPSASPDGKKESSPIEDCIVVGVSPTRRHAVASRALPRMTRSSSSTTSASSSSAELESAAGSQKSGSSRVGRPKRKRASSRAQGSSPKKQRQETNGVVGVPELSDVPDSPVAPASNQNDGVESAIPSSSAESSSPELPAVQDESSSQGSAVPESGDGMDVEGDDQDVQSQIALEVSISQRHMEEQQDDEEGSSPSSLFYEEPMKYDAALAASGEAEEENEKDAMTEVPPNTPQPDQVQNIMDLLRGGLDELRTARLSREDVYRIEDVLMDMKRELYEAEKRGRT